MNWSQVIRYAREHPDTARHQEGDSLETPLHAAVQLRPPVTVIHALLEAHADALSEPARNGEFPLHVACRYNASPDIIRALVRDRPNVARQETKWGNTPIVAHWRSQSAMSVVTQDEYSTEFWQKVHILLQAIAKSRQQEHQRDTNIEDHNTNANDKLYVLHAAVSLGSLGCPAPVLDFCLEKYPEQVRQRDGSGSLPLDLATAPTQWSCRAKRRYKPREQDTLQRLLQHYPEAAGMVNPMTGRLALQMALAHRHEWQGGVRYLVECTPQEALVQPDPVSGLIPFLTAATPKGETVVDLNTIYHVLRYLPAALEAAREIYIRADRQEDNDCSSRDNPQDACTSTTENLRINPRLFAVAAVGIAATGLAFYSTTI